MLWEAMLAGEAALSVEPVDGARDEDAAFLDAAVALVKVDMVVDRLGRGPDEGREYRDALAADGTWSDRQRGSSR